MLEKITWGSYVFFGVMTTFGAGFVWFMVPETKLISLEEMDVLFGSEGVAAADFERQAGINREIGLDAALERLQAAIRQPLAEGKKMVEVSSEKV